MGGLLFFILNDFTKETITETNPAHPELSIKNKAL